MGSRRAKILGISATTLILALLGSCAMEPQIATSALTDEEIAYSGNIRISLAHPFDVKKDDYELLMSVPSEMKSMAVCHIKNGGVCEPGSPLYYTTELVYVNSLRKFFKVEASALLEDGLTLQFMAYDASGKAADTRRVQFKKKAGSPPTTTTVTPTPTPTATPNGGGATGGGATGGGATGGAGGAVTEAQAQSIIQANCSGGPCHNFTAAGQKGNADSISRIQSGNMPKGKSMSTQDKQQLLQYMQN